MQNVAGYPNLITNCNSFNRANLVFPLARHDLSIRARDLDTSIKTRSVVSVSDDSSKAVVRADRAVVWSLLPRVAIVRPAEWPGCEFCFLSNYCIFLFDAKPGLFLATGIKNFASMNSEIRVCRFALRKGFISPLVRLSHHNDVSTLSERIAVVGHRLHYDLGVVCWSLPAGRPIVVPLWDICKRVDFALKSAALGP